MAPRAAGQSGCEVQEPPEPSVQVSKLVSTQRVAVSVERKFLSHLWAVGGVCMKANACDVFECIEKMHGGQRSGLVVRHGSVDWPSSGDRRLGCQLAKVS